VPAFKVYSVKSLLTIHSSTPFSFQSQLYSHPYWLVKVELLQLLSDLDFASLAYLEKTFPALSRGEHHFLGPVDIQNRILNVLSALIQVIGATRLAMEVVMEQTNVIDL
jgi:hypothetical protein